MGFAEGYLQKHAIGQPLIQSAPDPELKSIIAIPAYNESGLTTCLDSLFSCVLPGHPVEVIVLINSGEHTPKDIIDLNRKAYREVKQWCNHHQRAGFTVHAVLEEDLPRKHFGAGLARKLVMDEAVRRFDLLDRPAGIILSLDGDTLVDPDYLVEVTGVFEHAPETEGCSIRFAHPVGVREGEGVREGDRWKKGDRDIEREGEGEREGDRWKKGDGDIERVGERVGERKRERERERETAPYPAGVYEAIVNYELHQRYYLEAVRFTGYPYAFHTVGSAFAVRAGAYCRQGGMSKRQAGEDFYFIQKVAMQGLYTECNTTTVYPSPRPSDRVPFGTGPDIARQLDNPGKPYLTYAPELFRHIRDFYALIPQLYATTIDTPNMDLAGNDEPHNQKPGIPIPGKYSGPGSRGQYTSPALLAIFSSLPELMQNYLETTGFLKTLSEIRGNVASDAAFQQRFFRKFNMFWILKYLHFAEDQGKEKVEVGAAAREMLEMKKEMVATGAVPTHRELLSFYRNIQAKS